MDGLPLFAGIAIVYGGIILALTAPLTGRWLLVALMIALLPEAYFVFLSTGRSTLRIIAGPMATGVTFAAVIRSLKGFDTRLLRSAPR